MELTKGLEWDGHYFRGSVEGRLVSVEKISKKWILDNREYLELRKRMELQHHMNHQHIESLHYYSHDENYVYIVFEQLKQQGFVQRLQYDQITESHLKSLVKQLSSCIDYLRNRRVYVPISAENIYFDQKDNLKLSRLTGMQHRSNRRISYAVLGQIIYFWKYKRYMNLDVEQPTIIFWCHSEISEAMKDLVLKLAYREIDSPQELIKHDWFLE